MSKRPSPYLFRLLIAAVFFTLLTSLAYAQRQMENLGRGVIVLHKATTQAYVSWRLLATDPDTIGFNVYRVANGGTAVKLNSVLVTNTTDYLDTTAVFTQTNSWFVKPVTNGVEGAASGAWTLMTNSPVRQYFAVPLHDTGGAFPPYDVKFCWVGDLDGDGEYDFVVDRLSTVAATNQFLQAYKRDGTFLWQMDMGYNSVNQYSYGPGASAISFGDSDHVTVCDLDGDGKAEVLVKTANGVTVTNAAGVQVAAMTATNDTTEYISVINGLTGEERSRCVVTNANPADGPLFSRFIIAHCDGVHPSLVFSCENRNKTTAAFQEQLMAYDFRNGQLTQRWAKVSGMTARAHQVRVADVNHDGIDDICEIGSAFSGDDGRLLYNNELQHGDRYHIMDIDPDRPGLETFAIQQLNPTLLATMLYGNANGKAIKKWYGPTVSDVGRGVALAMDPNRKGCEMFSTEPGIYDCKGNQIFANNMWAPETVWWDSDLVREFEDGAGSGALSPVINKYDAAGGTAYRLQTLYSDNGGVHQAYGGRAAFWGDIFGDWREELVLVANDYSEIRIYSTAYVATNRLYCLMQNPQYRNQCTAKGYYQSSYPDFYLGPGMQPPAIPPVSNARLVWRGGTGANWDASGTANWFTNNLWSFNDTATTFNAADSVLFDLTGSNNAAINIVGSLTPGNVTVHSPKDYTFAGGALTGPMQLTKAGAGKLVFNNTNNYTGRTLICESLFLVNGALSNTPVTIRGGVWLDGRLGGTGMVAAAVSFEPGGGVSPGQGTNAPGTLTILGPVTLNNTLNDFDLSDDATGTVKTNDLLIITGNLTLLGTNTLTIRQLNATLPTGVYPLIRYAGTLTGGLTNLIVAGLDGMPLTLTNGGGQISLVIKSVRAATSLVWAGGLNGNAWDLVTTSNFLNGAAADYFVPQDSVTFSDAGGANANVVLTGTLVASNLLINATSNYVFNGTGALGGVAGLTKTNSGTLTINTDNTYTGRTIIGGGVLEVNDLSVAGMPGPLGSAPSTSPTNLVIYNGATLRFPGAQAYTDRGLTLQGGTNTLDVATYGVLINCSGQVTGSGMLQKIGPGTFILGASNNYSGGTLIKDGVLQLATEAANTYGFGTGLVTLDGGILNMLDDSGTYSTASYNVAVPAGSIGSVYYDSRIDLYGTLTGGGTLGMFIPFSRTTLYGNWSAFTGQINIFPGSAGDSRVGGSGTNGDFRVSNSYGYAKASIYLTNWMYAYHMTASSTVAIGELAGAPNAYLTAGAWQVGAKNTDATFAGHITGSSITKVGTGAWSLTGANTYTGTTTVNAGSLLVNGDDSVATGAVTVGAAGTLGGTGKLGGTTTVNGKLAPGSNAIGTLTFTNSLTLASTSTTLIELNRTNSSKCDQLVVGNLLTHGGTLSVSNLGSALTIGDTFQIFTATTRSGTFATVQLPSLAASLAWDTSALYTAGKLSVIASNGVVVPKALVWLGDGGANAWDVNQTANWLDTNNAASYFSANDRVTFSDAGSNNVPVNLTTNALPGGLLVNAGKNYIFSGAGVTGTNALIKAGAGMLTLANANNLYSGGTVISNGTLRLATTDLGLTHRWSFNNSLADFVGGAAAALVEVGASNATLTASNVTLAGGAWAGADYVSLGANLLPTNGPVTIELWATPNAIQNWARIFDFGASTTENLLMSWTTGTTLASDRVEWKDVVTSTSNNSNQPYTLGTEFHIVMVIEPGAGTYGTTRVTWYRAAATNAALGTARGTFNSTNTLAAFTATNCWLGRSEYSSDYTASASYNEVRIWNRALAAGELQVLHAAGPNALVEALNLGRSAGALPANTAVNLAGNTAILENLSGQPQAVGSLAGVAGSEVRLTAGALVAGGDNTSATFAGFISGPNGVVKLGSGAWTLTGNSTFTGATVVSNGTLLVNGSLAGNGITVAGSTLGGNGVIAGPATLRAGAMLAPGSNAIGALTFSTALTLADGSTNLFELSHAPLTNDFVRISGALTNGGTLIITNLAGTLAAGDSFQLFTAADFHGAFGSVILPALPASLVWNTNALNTSGLLSIVPITPPVIATLFVSNGSLIFSGTGGVANAGYYLVAATNLTTPLTNWQPLLTNQFDASGSFNVTNVLGTSDQQFFRLLVP